VPTGLVVNDDEIPRLAVVGRAIVEPVDPAGHGDHVGSGRDHALDPGRLASRVKLGDVTLDHLTAASAVLRRLRVVGKTIGEPPGLQQVTCSRHGPLAPGQPPPSGEGVVDAGAEAVVRPRRPFRRRRPVQVDKLVPTRAVQPGG